MNTTTTTLPDRARPAPRADVADVNAVDLDIDTRGPIRLGFWVLVVGFGLFLAWAAWAPLDEGVSAPATVTIESRSKTIQHLQGGVVRSVPVKEGQEVKQGDVLVELDDATMRASHAAIRENYLAQRAAESRLLAELADASAITFHPDLLAKGDAQAALHMGVQQRLFASRRAAQATEIAAVEQTIAGLQAQIGGQRQVIAARREQAALQARQLESVQGLAKEGYATRNQALQLEQTQAELHASLADLETGIQRAASAIAEARLRIAQRRQEFAKEVSAQLADVRREVQANQERLVAVAGDLERTRVRAPVDGQVVGLTVADAGGVVTPGQRLMEIVPRNVALVLNAKVAPHVIDRIRAGDTASVRFSAFAHSPQLVVPGKVITISADAITEQTNAGAAAHYIARVEVTPEGLKTLGNRALQPGMPADVLVRTGERSLLTYLVKPLANRVAAAMTEQ